MILHFTFYTIDNFPKNRVNRGLGINNIEIFLLQFTIYKLQFRIYFVLTYFILFLIYENKKIMYEIDK